VDVQNRESAGKAYIAQEEARLLWTNANAQRDDPTACIGLSRGRLDDFLKASSRSVKRFGCSGECDWLEDVGIDSAAGKYLCRL
jgi:hypothetical protein